MTYTESATLMQDVDFRGRIKVAALKYADSIVGEPSTTPAHTSRLKWAQGTFQNPELAAVTLQSPVVMDVAVQEAGAEITDEALQGAVETTVNKML